LFQALRDRIVSGEYPPGTLLSEKKLTQEFKVSRTPYREALKRLENMKLVKVVPRFGTYVSEIDINEILHAYEVRLHLEALAANLAAKRRTETDLEEFRTVLEECRQLSLKNDADSGSNVDESLHSLLCSLSKNPILSDTVYNLRLNCARIWTTSFWREYDYDQLFSYWERVYQAIRDKDGERASKEMSAHLQGSIDEIKYNIFGPEKE
jgi:DNA-binding GntR family transcriptional regulator